MMASQELLDTDTLWLASASLDNVVCDHDTGELKSIVSINNVAIGKLPVRLLRRFCAKLKVSGYKNLSRSSTIQLIVQRISSHEIEERLYPKESDVPSEGEAGPPPSEQALQDAPTSSIRYSSSNTSSSDTNDEDADASPTTNNLNPFIPENQGIAVDTSTQPRTKVGAAGSNCGSRTAKKKKSTSSPPACVTQIGTYIRAINVFFDQKHRSDVFSLGAAPSVQELDARLAFRGKAVYDRMLITYLDVSIPHIGVVAFSEDPYLPSMGIYDNAAMDFDVLTSEELKDTLAFINHFYKIAHRNNQKSGNHDDFHNFTRDKAYVFYYHLWLQYLPNLLCIAVPSLPGGVATDSTLHPSANTAPRNQRGGSRRRTTTNSSTEGVAAAMVEIGRSQSKKLLAWEEMNAFKRVNASVDRERNLLALLSDYDASLKRKIEDLAGYTSDMDEEKEVARAVIGIMKKQEKERCD
ncbi:hypothetical protein MHU86_15110 [Fragilaria crotonensis]|nr:hypothetical protein MHU86_15110 [Fragilaria crotonensis]